MYCSTKLHTVQKNLKYCSCSGCIIGHGANGVVVFKGVLERPSNVGNIRGETFNVAVKRFNYCFSKIDGEHSGEIISSQIKQEVENLLSVNHPNILRYVDCYEEAAQL